MNLTATVTSNVAAKVAAWKRAAETGLTQGVGAAAQLFVDEAKANVPVLTGNLRDHIRAVPVTDTPTVQVQAVTPTEDAGNKYGFDPAYARRIEFGFIGVDSLGRHYNQPADPYMRPAFDGQQDAAGTAIKTSIVNELQEAV